MLNNAGSEGDEFTYTFRIIKRCNMCNEPAERARVLGQRLNRSQGIRPTSRTGITTTVVQCRSCSLIFANPQPIPASLSQHYGVPPEAYWDAVCTDPEPGYFAEQVKTFFRLRENAPMQGGAALDIGAGLGKAMRVLTAAGLDTYGCEPSAPFRERALAPGDIPPERLQLASIETAEFPENTFDFITFGAVLEHLYDPSESILTAMRWLAPGGLIHIEVPSSRWLSGKVFNMVYRLQGLNYVQNISPMHSPFHLYEFGVESFRRHATQHGYRVVHHRYWEAATMLPSVLNPLLLPAMRVTNTGMQLDVWLGK